MCDDDISEYSLRKQQKYARIHIDEKIEEDTELVDAVTIIFPLDKSFNCESISFYCWGGKFVWKRYSEGLSPNPPSPTFLDFEVGDLEKLLKKIPFEHFVF